MAYQSSIVPSVSSGGGMSAQYLADVINAKVGSGTLIQILEMGPRLVLVWDDGV